MRHISDEISLFCFEVVFNFAFTELLFIFISIIPTEHHNHPDESQKVKRISLMNVLIFSSKSSSQLV